MIGPAQAYWNQRQVLADSRQRLAALAEAIDWANDLAPFQWGQLYAMALEFRPDLILELGRGYGNSTCLFTEAANRLGNCQVLSLDRVPMWQEKLPRVRRVVPEGWFKPMDARLADILSFDYAAAFAGKQRVLVFWDAHGFQVAECMLGRILPLLHSRGHLVMMHDLSDARYSTAEFTSDYGDKGMYKGGNDGSPKMRLGHIVSGVEQAIAITDFASRNGLELHSADHDLHCGIADKAEEMRALVGDLFALQAHWFYFSLEGVRQPRFPRFSVPRVRLRDQLRQRLRRLLHS